MIWEALDSETKPSHLLIGFHSTKIVKEIRDYVGEFIEFDENNFDGFLAQLLTYSCEYGCSKTSEKKNEN